MQAAQRKNVEIGQSLTYEIALDRVRDIIKRKIEEELKLASSDEQNLKNIEIKDKEYLAKKKKIYRNRITEAVISQNIKVDEYTRDEFIEEALADIVGYGALEDAFSDDEITDIFVIDYETIFVEKKGENIRYWKNFRSEQHYKLTLQRFIMESGKEMNKGDNKIVNFELYGDRGCSTDGIISTRSPSVTFRKHGYSEITKDDLIKYKVMNDDIVELIGLFLRGEMNVIYAGLTGSGKTTTIQALINHFIQDKRILICEDTPELALENPNTLALVSFKSSRESETVELYDLILTALRLKPRTIVVGEVRGKEAMAAVEAMETGHSTIFTMHGGEPVNIINRLVTKYLTAMPSLGIDVVERIIGAAVDYVCIQDAIPNVGRKLTILTEVTYDFTTRRVDLKPIFKFDFHTKDFKWINPISPQKAEVMLRRGIQVEELQKWLDGPQN